MKHFNYNLKIKSLHNCIIEQIKDLMKESNVTEVDLLGSNADHAYIVGYPDDTHGVIQMEVSRICVKKHRLYLDVILDIDTEELAESNEHGDISAAYQIYESNDFTHIIPTAGFDSVYESVWQILKEGK